MLQDLSPTTLISLLGDWHLGARFELQDNRYNLTIAQKRVRYILQAIHETIERNDTIENVVFCLLGDFCQNELIRPGSGFEIEFDIMRQTQETARMLQEVLMTAQGWGVNVKAYGVLGNHPRITRRQADSSPEVNFDRQAYEITNLLVGPDGPGITVGHAGWVNWKHDTYKMYATHGHVVRSALGIPAYGIARLRANLNSSDHADILFLGHFHTHTVLTNNNQYCIINGSLVGPDPYANSLALTGGASQAIITMNPTRGILSVQEARVNHIQR